MRAFRTHLAGLWYHRDMVSRRPVWAINEVFFLFYGATLSLAFIAGVIAVIVQPTLIPIIGGIAALFTTWIFARRAAIVGEVAAYTNEKKWLVWFWAPVILLIVQIPSALIAILTVRRQPSFDYKGRRESFTT
jgi:hypothetical protein